MIHEEIQSKAINDELNPEQERLEEIQQTKNQINRIKQKIKKADTDEEKERLFDMLRDQENHLDLIK